MVFFSYFCRDFWIIMEKLFHYVWKHRLFPLTEFTTTDGRSVEVVDVGLQNFDAGPDFFNAKVRLDGQMWAGNVELHTKSSQWHQHGHHKDKAYNGVVLHVVEVADCEIENEKGECVPQIVLPIPEKIKTNYEHLLQEDRYPRCHKLIPHIPITTIHTWLSHLYIERLERKEKDILSRLETCGGSWEDAFFQTLARNFGFSLNADAFEQWAKSFSLSQVNHHRDDLFQIESFFFGQAGLLDPTLARPKQREKMEKDEYFSRLKKEYDFLRRKFSLTHINPQLWRFLRLRPQSFPSIRISQLAQLHYNHTAGMSQLLSCQNMKEVEKALSTAATDYWQTHYFFGEESPRQEKRLTRASIDIIVINTIVPFLFAYGHYRKDKALKERAFSLMENVVAEKNNIIRLWRECGLMVENACDSQALIQLKREYCDRKDCLRCRIGHKYLQVDNL